MASSTSTPLDELEREWHAPGRTAIDLASVDVNQVLADHYETDPPGFVYTASMLWDMEQRKAAAPDIYLPNVVKPGSLETFGLPTTGPAVDFVRVTEQRLWLDPATYGTIIEYVHLDEEQRRAFFIGAASFDTPDGRTVRAGTGQPLFHVEHSVAGTEQRPLNNWRIVHLTDKVDPVMTAQFAELSRQTYLREFIEVHLTRELGITLRRK
ncbi:hypothetical protein GCM10010464_71220 [Pseudonocardia yunnanensis]|uniref:Uncharacterized protein n=1 Tax=Pseudonocardia yunnanensis TaxID=58107 RepID=A0ABW4F1V0_9PSEU